MKLAEAELAEDLAAGGYERSKGRRRYRKGKRDRRIGMGGEARVIELLRARITEWEREMEWQSRWIGHCQRRVAMVDRALLDCHLSGANGRRIRAALSPLLRGAPPSKRAIKRMVRQLEALFSHWRRRSLATKPEVFLYRDGSCCGRELRRILSRCQSW